MERTLSVKFFNRGPGPLVRLVFFSLLSVVLLFVDQRYQYLSSARSVLSTLIYPLQRLTTIPPLVWHETDDFFTSHATLRRDNQQLREQHAQDATQLQKLQEMETENVHLRSLLEMRERLNQPMRLVRVIYGERDPFRHKFMVDVGAKAGIQTGEAVIDDQGIVGQVTRVNPLLSEVTLITDKDHEVPVQVVRNGLRAILYGSGDATELDLRYTPATADVQPGDVLVTSGIDGTYPPGLPVAKITRVERDPAYPFARVSCAPATGVNNHRWVFILSGLESLPPRLEDKAAETPPAKSKKPKKEAP